MRITPGRLRKARRPQIRPLSVATGITGTEAAPAIATTPGW